LENEEGPFVPPPSQWEFECRVAVDALFEALASPRLGPEIHKLDLCYFGQSAASWHRYINRFGPGITSLEIDTRFITNVEAMAAQVSQSLRSA
jgi:hypothetical protein